MLWRAWALTPGLLSGRKCANNDTGVGVGVAKGLRAGGASHPVTTGAACGPRASFRETPFAESGPAEGCARVKPEPGRPQWREGRGADVRAWAGERWGEVGPTQSRDGPLKEDAPVTKAEREAQETKAEKVPALTELLLCSHPFPLPPQPLTSLPRPESPPLPPIPHTRTAGSALRAQLPAPAPGPSLRCRDSPLSPQAISARCRSPLTPSLRLPDPSSGLRPHCCWPCSSPSEPRDPQNESA